MPFCYAGAMGDAPGSAVLRPLGRPAGHRLLGAAACASALVFGLLPALRSSRVDLLSVMNDDLSPRGGARGRFRMGLVVAQVAVSMLLLVGAGLVTRSLDAARQADAGIRGTSVVSVVDLTPNGYDEARGRAFFSSLLDASAPSPASSRPPWRRTRR